MTGPDLRDSPWWARALKDCGQLVGLNPKMPGLVPASSRIASGLGPKIKVPVSASWNGNIAQGFLAALCKESFHPSIHPSMHPSIHPCMHACMHACTHTYETYIHTYKTCMHACNAMQCNAIQYNTIHYLHTYKNANTSICIYIYIYICTHTSTHASRII